MFSVLQALGFLAVEPGRRNIFSISRRRPAKVCCCRAYLRGFSQRALSDPARDYYHLEVISLRTLCGSITEALDTFRLQARYFQRKNNQFVVYIKEAEKIGEFCVLLLPTAVCCVLRISVVKGVRNKINRLVNCETANLTKTALAAQEQLASIRLVTNHLGLENIPSALREIARLRLRYPEATLKELGGLADPALSKSTVNHRLRRLNALARKIKGQS